MYGDPIEDGANGTWQPAMASRSSVPNRVRARCCVCGSPSPTVPLTYVVSNACQAFQASAGSATSFAQSFVYESGVGLNLQISVSQQSTSARVVTTSETDAVQALAIVKYGCLQSLCLSLATMCLDARCVYGHSERLAVLFTYSDALMYTWARNRPSTNWGSTAEAVPGGFDARRTGAALSGSFDGRPVVSFLNVSSYVHVCQGDEPGGSAWICLATDVVAAATFLVTHPGSSGGQPWHALGCVLPDASIVVMQADNELQCLSTPFVCRPRPTKRTPSRCCCRGATSRWCGRKPRPRSTLTVCTSRRWYLTTLSVAVRRRRHP